MPTCAICNSRKAKRACPGRGDEICPQCCATEREISIDCPASCSYLAESRRHERREFDAANMPFPEVQISEQFLRNSELVLILTSAFLKRASQPAANAIDADLRQALDTVIRSRRAGESGIVYDAKSENPIAQGIADRFAAELAKFTSELQQREEQGMFTDRQITNVLVFLARVAHGHDNGRPRCRGFLHYLEKSLPESAQPGDAEPPASIVTP
jgi:hypothetical protein